MNKFIFPISLLISAVLLAGCVSLAGDIKPPADYVPPVQLPAAATAVVYPSAPPDPVNGQKVFAEQCAACHGDAGKGNGQITTGGSSIVLSDVNVLHSAVPQTWFGLISNGSSDGKMPGFSSKLDEASRWDLISYLFSLENTPEQMAAGAEVYLTVCSQCHGENGKGDGPKASSVSVTPSNFTDQSVMAAISNQDMVNIVVNGLGNDMPAFGNMLSDDKKWAVANYIRSIAYKPVEQSGTGITEQTPIPVGTTSVETTPTSENVGGVGVTATPGIRIVDVTGKITNNSGAAVPAGMKVTLQSYDNMVPSVSSETIARSDGSFSFPQQEVPNGRIFIASVEYNGQQFSSQPSMHPGGTVDETQNVIDLPIQIYEATTDRTVVKADRLHVFLDFTNPGIVQVVELYLISNTSNQVLVADKTGGGVLDYALPAGAQNLQFQDSILGERYLQTDTGFSDTVPVRPGTSSHQVLFAYDLPYTKKAQINLPISVNVDAISVMIPTEGIKLKSELLTDGGVKSNQGMNFHLFTGSNLKAGSTLDMTVSGTVGTSTGSTSKVQVNPILFGAGVLLLVVSGVGLFFYRKQKSTNDLPAENVDSELIDPDSIMDEIIALDDLHKEGKLKDEIYTARRDELKKRLKSIK